MAFDRDVAYLGGTVLRGESPDAYNCVENQWQVTEKEADAPKLEGQKKQHFCSRLHLFRFISFPVHKAYVEKKLEI